MKNRDNSLLFDLRARLEIPLHEDAVYLRAIDRLALRARSEPRLLSRDPMGDGLTLGWLLARRERVARELRRAFVRDDFRFGPVLRRRAHVGGKERELYLASWPDRVLHRVLAERLQHALEPGFSPRLFSFRPGRSQRTALRSLERYVRRLGTAHVIKADVSQYGESIDRARLSAELVTALGPSLLTQRTQQALAPHVLADGAPLARGLPTGAAFVPVLENFYLGPLDTLLTSHDVFHARFGDDFLLASPDPAALAAAWDEACALLAARGLTLKSEKVQRAVLGQAGTQALAWLGARVSRTGQLGLSDAAWAEWRATCVSQCQEIVAAVFALPERERVPAARAALSAVLERRRHAHIAAKDVSASSLAGLDAKLTQTIVRAAARVGRMKKRDAWRWYRRLSLRGLSAAR